MTDIENRLRSELRAQAQRTQPDDLRDLRAPAPRPGPRARPGRRPARRALWLAPAAAALAVIGVIAGIELSVPGRPAPPARPAAAALPRYYLEIPDGGGDIDEPGLTVRQSADGAAVSQVSVPGVVLGYAATADDRTFILAGWTKPQGTAADTFYRLTLSGSGHVRRLQKLPLRVRPGASGYGVGGIALAPDGQTLAVAVNPSGEEAAVVAGHPAVEVISLRTGAVRTWTEPSPYRVSDLSWARGSASLQFLNEHDPVGRRVVYTVRRLDVSRPGGSLLSASRPVPIPASAGQVSSPIAVDNGRVVLAWTTQPRPIAIHPGNSVLAEYSASTGRRLRVLFTFYSRGLYAGEDTVWSADPSGQHLLIGGTQVTGVRQVTSHLPGGGVSLDQVPVTRVLFGRLDNGRFTALPDRPAPGRPARQDQAGVW